MHTQKNLQVRIARRISEFSEGEWSRVFPDVLESYRFLKAMDESGLEGFSFLYIMLYDRNIPVAAAPCFISRFPLDAAVEGLAKKILDLIRSFIPHFLRPKVVFCGLPMGRGRIGALEYPGETMQKIHDCLEEIARAEKAAMIIFKDFTDRDKGLLKPLLSKGFFRLESFPCAIMDINFDSFDDFLRTMSQSSKDNLKRNLKKSANVAIKLEIVSCLEDELVPDVHRLYLETINGKENSFEVLTPEFFENISRNMPQETKYFLWRVDGKLAAFALCLVKNSHFQDHYLGFDYSIAYKYGLYFVRFRDLMKWCIANDIKKYEMGVAGYEAKRRLGFHFLRYYFYMKHRNKIMNFFFALLSPYLGPANFNPIFKYLKENNKKYVVEPSE